tara:strand:+ start:675 stop:1145 length:471 start_codon:yes stop_codon:yes gene_type:complete
VQNTRESEENNGVPDLSTGWLGSKRDIAMGIIETIIEPVRGPRPKRLHPDRKGFTGFVIEALEGGFRALGGSRLWLLDKNNKKAASFEMDNALVVRVLGVPVITIADNRATVPVIEVGSPGRSWIELYMQDGQKRYVSITASGRLSVRKTPPERKI